MHPHGDDAQLVAAHKAGSPEAMGGIYDRHAGAVFRYLCGMVGMDAAEDLLQESFLQAAESLAGYEERGRMRQWLLSIARNKALDLLRQRKRHPVRLLGDEEVEEIGRNEEPPVTETERREMGARIRDALDRLPEMQRTVFLLREEAELPFKEIAQMLSLPLNTALSHMHRAVGALRKALSDLEDAPVRQEV